MKKADPMVITVRSFVPPEHPPKDYELGKPFQMEVPKGITLAELAQMFLSRNIELLGIKAVNGRLASENTVLSPGDQIDLYALIDGG